MLFVSPDIHCYFYVSNPIFVYSPDIILLVNHYLIVLRFTCFIIAKKCSNYLLRPRGCPYSYQIWKVIFLIDFTRYCHIVILLLTNLNSSPSINETYILTDWEFMSANFNFEANLWFWDLIPLVWLWNDHKTSWNALSKPTRHLEWLLLRIKLCFYYGLTWDKLI